MDIRSTVTITHWLPILTFCPVNKLPDFIFVEVTFVDTFAELYGVRSKIRKLVSKKLMFMEDIAKMVFDEFPEANTVKVRLMFNKHIVEIRKL